MRRTCVFLSAFLAVTAIFQGNLRAEESGRVKTIKLQKNAVKKKGAGNRAGAERLEEIKRIVMDANRIGKLAFSPDSRTVVCRLWPWDYMVFELKTGQELLNRGVGEQAVVGRDTVLIDLVVGPEGKVVFSHVDQMIRVRDKVGEKVNEMKPRPLGENFDSLGYSDQGGWLVGRSNTEVRIWDLATGTPRKQYVARETALDLDPKSGRLVTINQDHDIRVWDARTGKIWLNFPDVTKRIARVKFSPDGRLVAAWAGGDQGFYLIDPIQGGISEKIVVHDANISDVSFLGNGLVVSGGADRTIRIWNTATGELVYGRRFLEDVRLVGASPDGRYLVVVLKNELYFYRDRNRRG